VLRRRLQPHAHHSLAHVPRQRLPRVVPFLLMSIGPIMTIVLLPVVLVLYAGFWCYEWARTRAFGATASR
jgi:hypothetical protein